jgi:hypothetical protein
MKKWTARLRARFEGREALPADEAWALYWKAFPRGAVLEVLELIQEEYGLAPGLLRPDDRLSLLFTPVQTRNPLEWLFFQGMTEDRQSEMEYRLKRRGVDGRGADVSTLGDYVELWARGRERI